MRLLAFAWRVHVSVVRARLCTSPRRELVSRHVLARMHHTVSGCTVTLAVTYVRGREPVQVHTHANDTASMATSCSLNAWLCHLIVAVALGVHVHGALALPRAQPFPSMLELLRSLGCRCVYMLAQTTPRALQA